LFAYRFENGVGTNPEELIAKGIGGWKENESISGLVPEL
jgi:hypothetical protein